MPSVHPFWVLSACFSSNDAVETTLAKQTGLVLAPHLAKVEHVSGSVLSFDIVLRSGWRLAVPQESTPCGGLATVAREGAQLPRAPCGLQALADDGTARAVPPSPAAAESQGALASYTVPHDSRRNEANSCWEYGFRQQH